MGTAITVVVNPAAAGGKAPQRLQTIRTVLNAAGVHYLTRYSKSLRHAGVLAAETAVQRHHVAALGGDGMAGAGAGAAAQAKSAGDGVFAIIPAPRGNDLARTYGIPFGSAEAGADRTQVLVAGSIYIGIASVAGQIAGNFRLISGPLVYPVSALRALADWKPATFSFAVIGSVPSTDALGTPQEFRATPW